MRAERTLLHIGEYLVGRSCRRLPPEIRDERYQEWAAELPAILNDRQIRLAPYRALRMLGYAGDTLRGSALMPGRARRRPAVPSILVPGLLFAAGLVAMVWDIRNAVRAPGHELNYVQVVWSLFLVAWPVSQYVRSGARMTGLIVISSGVAGEVVYIWNAVQAPGDWVNYLLAALLFLPYLAWWLIRQWVRTGGHKAGRAGQVTAS
jgi:hypothetical protein